MAYSMHHSFNLGEVPNFHVIADAPNFLGNDDADLLSRAILETGRQMSSLSTRYRA